MSPLVVHPTLPRSSHERYSGSPYTHRTPCTRHCTRHCISPHCATFLIWNPPTPHALPHLPGY